MRLALPPAATCQFPLWGDERPSHSYCGAPSLPGSSYCRRHHARCWHPSRRPIPLPPPATDLRTWLSLLSRGSA